MEGRRRASAERSSLQRKALAASECRSARGKSCLLLLRRGRRASRGSGARTHARTMATPGVGFVFKGAPPGTHERTRTQFLSLCPSHHEALGPHQAAPCSRTPRTRVFLALLHVLSLSAFWCVRRRRTPALSNGADESVQPRAGSTGQVASGSRGPRHASKCLLPFFRLTRHFLTRVCSARWASRAG